MKEIMYGLGLVVWLVLFVMSAFNGFYFLLAIVYPFAVALAAYNTGMIKQIIVRKIIHSA